MGVTTHDFSSSKCPYRGRPERGRAPRRSRLFERCFVAGLQQQRDGKTTVIPVSGSPNTHQLVADDTAGVGHLDVSLGKGLQAFSFTYG